MLSDHVMYNKPCTQYMSADAVGSNMLVSGFEVGVVVFGIAVGVSICSYVRS